MAKNINIDLKDIDLKKLGSMLKNFNIGSVKKYASLFPSIGLLVISMILLLIAMLIGRTIAKKMDASAQMASQLLSVVSSVPSEKQAKVEEDYLKKYQEDVNALELIAINTSRRELICYTPQIFPKPTDSSGQVYDIFGGQYRSAIEKLLERIGAKDAPSDAEIRSATGAGTGAAAGDGMMGMRMGMGGSGVGPSNAMVDAVCLKRSDEIPVYANPGIFSWYEFWDNFTFKSVDDSLKNCWSSQVAFWIYEDVVATAEVMNAGSKKVASSPVKRLLGVRFNGPVTVAVHQGTMGGMTGGAATDVLDDPIYVKGADPAAAAPAAGAGVSPFMKSSLTGRVGNDQIDVIHFAVSVILDASSVSAFMKELCSAKTHTFQDNGKTETAIHNQITILQYNLEPVLRDDPVHMYYRYGKAGVVRLNLVCEYVFNRKGCDAFKPDVIKSQGTEQSAGGQQPSGMPGTGFPTF